MLRTLYALSFCAFSLGLAGTIAAQSVQAPANIPTIRVTSRLVFLDVTVLDKKGHPVVTGLTKDDFVITEEKQPQPIFSFQPPESIALHANESEREGPGNSPAM